MEEPISTIIKLELNAKFNSYKELQQSVEQFQKEHFVQLWKRDSRTIKCMKTRAPNKNYNENLVYGSIKFCCVHGGKDIKTSCTGQRPNQATLKKSCPFSVHLCTTPDGQQLLISNINNEHNHEINETLFSYLPRQRHLSVEEKKDVENMLKVNANKKMLQNYVMQKTGKKVLLKDLHNIGSEIKRKDKDGSKGPLEQVHMIFADCPGAVVEYVTDDQNQLKAIFFQDEHMKSTFQHFPEVILVDATYKTNNLRMPLYFIIAVDGNGQSEIVALFLLTQEDEELLSLVIELFKKHNPAWQNVKVVLTDKDMSERNVLGKAMPEASLQLCLFHVLRSFRREITPEKLGITSGDKIRALEILQKLCYARSETEYDVLYERLTSELPGPIVSYFNKNWHVIRSEWVDGLKDGVNLGNRTNNRIESINDKVKSVLNHHATLPEFAENILIAITSLRTERDHKTVSMFLKKPVNTFEKESTEYQYQELVTPYALNYVLRQLNSRRSVTLKQESDDDTWFTESSEGKVIVQPSACTCTFYKCMLLPCRHIFRLREMIGLNLFQTSGMSERWKLSTYTKSHRLFSAVAGPSPDAESRSSASISVSTPSRKRKLSQSEKYRQTKLLTQQIATLVSEATGVDYQQKVETLQNIIQHWNDGKRCVVVEVLEIDEANKEANEERINSDFVATGNSSNIETTALVDDVGDSKEEELCERDSFNVESEAITSIASISDIVLPPAIKKRGRPKGMTQTVIGLPKKRARKSKCVPFIQKPSNETDMIILEWFVGKEIAKSALSDSLLVEEQHIETRPEMVSSSCLDKLVNISLIKKYCTEDAWKAIQNIYSTKLQNTIYFCNICNEDADVSNGDQTQSIMCSSCLQWLHLSCARLKTSPKAKHWFCNFCKLG